MGEWRVGVDVGGTFTDFAALDTATGSLLVEKVPTTPHNPARGVIAGLERLVDRGVHPDAIASFLHGTTITTNALIEMRGVRVGLLLTAARSRCPSRAALRDAVERWGPAVLGRATGRQDHSHAGVRSSRGRQSRRATGRARGPDQPGDD